MTALMLGFRLIHKLVDNVFVKPTPSDPGFHIITQTQAIVNRMMTYVNNRNWQIIGIDGWPVANGGGDLILSAYPLSVAALHITGNSYVNPITRKLKSFSLADIQFCLTGFGLRNDDPIDRIEACNDVNTVIGLIPTPGQFTMTHLEQAVPPGVNNNQNYSFFQLWQLGDTPYPFDSPITKDFDFTKNILWFNKSANEVGDILSDFIETNQISVLPLPFDEIEWNGAEIKQYNLTILGNLGTISGLWDKHVMKKYTEMSGNTQLELISAIIRNELPVNAKSYYESFLNSMTFNGSYSLFERIDASNSFKLKAPGDWFSENRWTNPGQDDFEGIFNGLDYLLFHNLYRIVFKNQLNETFEEDYYCSCIQTPQYTNSTNTVDELNAKNKLNLKATYLAGCQENIFSSVQNNVIGTFNVNQQFDNYSSYKIFNPKYLKEDVIISNGGVVNVNTTLINCSKKLTIQSGGNLILHYSKYLQLPATGITDNSGDIIINSGTTYHLKSKLILRNGSRLIVENGGKLIVDYGAIVEYYNGAQIITYGENSEILIRGTLKLMNQTTFEINHMNSPSSGRVIFEGQPGFIAEQTNSKFRFRGKSIDDEFVILKPNAKIWIQDLEISDFHISNCHITFNLNNKIEALQPITLLTAKFTGIANNLGIELTDKNKITSCEFYDVPITAKLHLENKDRLNVSSSKFYKVNSGINTSTQYLVYVEGKGYNIATSEFHNAPMYCIQSKNLVNPSSLLDCSFQGNRLSAMGIFDNSTTEIISKKCTYTDLYVATYKNAGKLTLKCNDFNSMNYANIAVSNGCILNMSSDDWGGYNTLNNTTNGSNILMVNAYINLANGYNHISSQSNPIISGTTALYYSFNVPSYSISAAKNQWGSGTNVNVHPAKFQLRTAFGNHYVTINTSNPIMKPTCGFYDPYIPLDPGTITFRSTGITDSLIPVISNLNGDSIDLISFYQNGKLKMELIDTLGNDLEAINIFDHIFSQNLSKTDSISSKYLNLSLENIKNAYENAYLNGKIDFTEHSSSFDEYTSKYANALMYMSDEVIDSTNYVKQFYNELNKAHLFRMLGRSEIGITILEELEKCGLDSTEQQNLNYWKQQYLIDLVVNDLGVNAIDTTLQADTTGFTQPTELPINSLSFGSVILDLNNILFPNCDFYTRELLMNEMNGFVVFPNPTDNEITIKIENFEGVGKIFLTSMDGKILKLIDTDPDNHFYFMTLNELQAGIYFVNYISESGVKKSTKVVLN
jgi:hypothetical protein